MKQITNTNITSDKNDYDFRYFASLPRAKKLHLIAFLSNSILEEEDGKQTDEDVLDRICGSWSEDEISTDELIKVCESGRNITREIIEI